MARLIHKTCERRERERETNGWPLATRWREGNIPALLFFDIALLLKIHAMIGAILAWVGVEKNL